MKYYNVIIDDQNIFNQPVKQGRRTYKIIWKFAHGNGDDHKTDCLFDYPYFKEKLQASLQ